MEPPRSPVDVHVPVRPQGPPGAELLGEAERGPAGGLRDRARRDLGVLRNGEIDVHDVAA